MIEMKKYLVFILCVYFLQSCGSKRTIYNYEDEKTNFQSYYCDVIRMIQYPTGGGFLSCHNDKIALFIHFIRFSCLID